MNRAWLAISMIVLILIGGCDTGLHQRMNCICLIDYSGSLSEETLHRYIEIISTDILRRMGERDRLIVLPIDEGAKMEAVKLVYEDLSDKKFSFHTDGYTHASDSLRMRLRKYADKKGPEIASKLLREKTVREKYTYFTDIFSALEQVATLLERNQPDNFWNGVERFITGKKRIVSTNLIILFSDMIQESNETSFSGPEGCTPDEARFTIDKLRAFNRIPDLSECKIFVNGRTGKTNQQVDNIKNFWSQYFKETKADLIAYDYDTGHEIDSFLTKKAIIQN
jgi:hypothetical protein